MSAGFADLLSLSGVWLPIGTAPAPEAGWRGVLAMCGVWIDGGTSGTPAPAGEPKTRLFAANVGRLMRH